jgi:glycine cleavage system H protein
VNETLEAHPEFVNEDAFGKGWMVKIKLAGALAGDLLDADAYAKLVSEESH